METREGSTQPGSEIPQGDERPESTGERNPSMGASDADSRRKAAEEWGRFVEKHGSFADELSTL
jgi:hypothetical protein